MNDRANPREGVIVNLTRRPPSLSDTVMIQGRYSAKLWRDGECIWQDEGTNLITTEGMNHMLNATFDKGSTTQVSQWYMGLATVTSAATDSSTGSQLSGTGAVTEMVDYDGDTARNAINFSAAASRAVTNGTAVSFTMDSGVSSVNIVGAFICDNGTQSNAANYLWCVINFSGGGPTVNENDQLDVTYTVTFGTTSLAGASDGSP